MEKLYNEKKLNLLFFSVLALGILFSGCEGDDAGGGTGSTEEFWHGIQTIDSTDDVGKYNPQQLTEAMSILVILMIQTMI